MSRMATAASYSAAPSPGSLAAHIQLPEQRTSSSALTCAHTRLVSASPTLMRAMAPMSTSPLIGCSPMAVAAPVVARWLCAITATSATVSCSGPAHCCCAMRPVTLRSTFVVRNRFEPTDRRRSTRSSASLTVSPPGSSSGTSTGAMRWNSNRFWGMAPSTWSRSRFTGVVSSVESCTTMRPSPVTRPTYANGTFSRSHRSLNSTARACWSSSASFSWYSAPQISSTERVSSPTSTSRIPIRAPAGLTISFSTLQLPPAPWSWMLTIGLSAPSSTHARITRCTFCSISASPRCTALKSSSATFSPCTMLEAAPPPIPIR